MSPPWREGASWIAAYIGSIVAVNWLFTVVPLVPLPFDLGWWPPVSLVVGLVFVLRDYAQRACGHWVILAMLAGGALSYFMASPAVAAASVAAFLVGETADWLVYTVTRRPFRTRVLASSALGTPLDSAVFLALIGQFSVAGVATMTLSKMVAALAVYASLRRELPQSA